MQDRPDTQAGTFGGADGEFLSTTFIQRMSAGRSVGNGWQESKFILWHMQEVALTAAQAPEAETV